MNAKYRLKQSSTPGYWRVEEYISNQFCGHWHTLFTSSHEVCIAFVRRSK